jgi:molybdenum cofactor cytidylyltransferase
LELSRVVADVFGIVLAAGSSSRLGRPKQLLELEGRPLLQHTIDCVEQAGLADVVLVLGHRHEDIRAAVTLPIQWRVVINPNYLQGQSTSLRVGLEAASAQAQAALLVLGDQPAISPVALRAVVDAYQGPTTPVVQAIYRGTPGHPVLFDRGVWADLVAIEGDRGARDLLRQHPDWLTRVKLDQDLPPDLDTWEDYERLVGHPVADIS